MLNLKHGQTYTYSQRKRWLPLRQEALLGRELASKLRHSFSSAVAISSSELNDVELNATLRCSCDRRMWRVGCLSGGTSGVPWSTLSTTLFPFLRRSCCVSQNGRLRCSRHPPGFSGWLGWLSNSVTVTTVWQERRQKTPEETTADSGNPRQRGSRSSGSRTRQLPSE